MIKPKDICRVVNNIPNSGKYVVALEYLGEQTFDDLPPIKAWRVDTPLVDDNGGLTYIVEDICLLPINPGKLPDKATNLVPIKETQ